MHRDKCDEENVRSRMRLQWDEEMKIAKSDYIINNDGIEMLIPQVLKINAELRTLTISICFSTSSVILFHEDCFEADKI